MVRHISDKLSHLIEVISQLSKNKSLSELIEHLYMSVSADDLDEFAPRHLFECASAIFEGLKSSKHGAPKVSYYIDPKQDDYIVLQVFSPDMPFLVDSLCNELKIRQIDINLITHTMLEVSRDKNGKFLGFAKDGKREYVIQIHIPNRFHEEYVDSIVEKMQEILECVSCCVADWRQMEQMMRQSCAHLEGLNTKDTAGVKSESLAFLEWLIARHFVFLGVVSCEFDGNKITVNNKSKLGLLKSPVYPLDSLVYHKELKSPDYVMVRKWDTRSIVHRTAHMDVIICKRFSPQGKCVGADIYFGLFTSTVYYQSVLDIPLMRQKVKRVIEMYGYPETSHNCKELVTVVESFPRGELLQMDVEELFSTATGIVSLTLIPRVKVFLRKDHAEKFISCIVFIPEKKFSTEVRGLIEEIVCNELNGTVSKRYIQIGETSVARVQFIVKLSLKGAVLPSAEDIEKKIIAAVSNWTDELYASLLRHYSKDEAAHYFGRYEAAFDMKYQSESSADKAVHDIKFVEQALSSNGVFFDVYSRTAEEESHTVHLKIYAPHKELALSSMLPLIEHLGLKALDVETNKITLYEGGRKTAVYLSHFRLQPANTKWHIDNKVCEKARDALYKVWMKELDDDEFNSLILACGLSYREANLVRAYVRYLRQTKYPLSMDYTVQVLIEHGHLTAKIVHLFDLKFNPQHTAKERKFAMELEKQIKHDLNEIRSANEDRAIRSLLGVVLATIRTNYYQTTPTLEHKEYLSFKLRSSQVTDLIEPKPYAEIFVYSSRFEGIHLRGGPIARGGLRWSDRPEDFRTEVLGLMKAQMTKNSVIVPVGSKGGFVIKSVQPSDGRDVYLEEGVKCYKLFLSGLLDITDNLVEGKVLVPEYVVRYDGDDPYLVVAADKGTATFSDYANEMSAKYGFWLADAFASGGSVGYDHKAMGITAKGAWISVLRHFDDMGMDITQQEFTCVGIGDMSGDVFGNGMLLSNKVKLVAAFNHMHIFIDPNPDAAKSFAERQRLFNRPRSAWSDYERGVISNGGNIFERSAKNITISVEAAEALGVVEREFTPDGLIRAILMAPVDLLWNGGIGTYVKAKTESNERVGDKANDNLRINGSQLRAKIVGEGGNLGFTQLGRIEYALVGGRINTDFIDNSAGVDCSDHEVNIKIALAGAVRAGKLKMADRDKLLTKMTDQVGELVLVDNYKQTQLLTLEQQANYSKINSHSWLIKHLESNKELDRGIEFLPSEEELQKLIVDKKNLTRPELSVLVAYAKNSALKMFNDVDLSADAYLHKYLLQYFPKDVSHKYEPFVKQHGLRKQIIATVLVNDFVNMLGCTFFHQLLEESGASAQDVIKAFVVVREVFGIEECWKKIEALGSSLPVELKMHLFRPLQSMIGRNITWLLTIHHEMPDVEKLIDFYKDEVGMLSKLSEKVVTSSMKEEKAAYLAKFVEYPVALEVAKAVSKIRAVKTAFDIIYVAKSAKRSVEECARVYYACGDTLYIRWLIAKARDFVPRQYMQILAVRTLINDLHAIQMRVVMEEMRLNKQGDKQLSLVKTKAKNLGRLNVYVKELMASDTTEAFVSKLTIAIKYLREIAVSGSDMTVNIGKRG